MADVKIRQLQREGKELTEEEIEAIREPVLERYKRDVEAYTSTSEIWDDGILDPIDTRNALAMSISAALNAPSVTRITVFSGCDAAVGFLTQGQILRSVISNVC